MVIHEETIWGGCHDVHLRIVREMLRALGHIVYEGPDDMSSWKRHQTAFIGTIILLITSSPS